MESVRSSLDQIKNLSPAERKILGPFFAVLALAGCHPQPPSGPTHSVKEVSGWTSQMASLVTSATNLPEKQTNDNHHEARISATQTPLTSTKTGEMDCKNPIHEITQLCLETQLREQDLKANATSDQKLQKKFESGQYPSSKEAFAAFETLYAAGVESLNFIKQTAHSPNIRKASEDRLAYLNTYKDELKNQWATSGSDDATLSKAIAKATDDIEKLAVFYLQKPEDAITMNVEKSKRLKRKN